MAGSSLDGRPEIRNTGVVKSTGVDQTTPSASVTGARSVRGPRGLPESGLRGAVAEGGTRVAVARLLLERGPVTAVAVAEELELSGPAVRRHLDALVADGEVTTRDAPRRGRRGRGRPARLYLLTEEGRVRFGHGYDDLAVAALRFLAETGGPGAVRDFADRRAAQLVARFRERSAVDEPADQGQASPETVAERVSTLASVLSAQGYAAAAKRAANGEQLCQHHCPVAHVAAEFPQLCEAETHAFAELLGTHVQRLATIARGDAACTTHVPLGVPGGSSAQDREPHVGRTAEAGHPVRQAVDTTTTTIPKGRQRV
jgi:predicted ArsR family transcriptional regulator